MGARLKTPNESAFTPTGMRGFSTVSALLGRKSLVSLVSLS
jgi:hypothetical protein